jgi:hypothetical protein
MRITLNLDSSIIKHLIPLAFNNRFDTKWGQEFYKEISKAEEFINRLEKENKEGRNFNRYFIDKLSNIK